MEGMNQNNKQPAARGFGGREDPAPELNESGEAAATEEEQQDYELLTVRARKLIFGDSKDKILTMLGTSETPSKGMGKAAAMIIKSLMDSAKQGGRELSQEAALEAGTDIIEDLSDLAKSNKVFEYDDDSDEQTQLEDAMLWGVKFFGDGQLQAGEITPELQQHARQVMDEGIAQEKAGKPNKVNAAVKDAINQPATAPGLVSGAMQGGA